MLGHTCVFYRAYERGRGLHALCALFGLLGGCDTTDSAEITAAAYGYPLDTDYATYASAYDAVYTDAWGYPVPLPAPYANDDAGMGEESDPVKAIRAAALGSDEVCPGHVKVEPQRAHTPCGAGVESNGQAAVGVKLTFTGCQLGGGGTLDGTVEVTSIHSASDESCSSNTTIHVSFSGEITNLAFTSRTGKKLVIVSLTDTGEYDHAPGAPPTSVNSSLKARIQRYAADGALNSDNSLTGQALHTVKTAPLTITTDATFNMTNAAAEDGGSATVKVNSLVHSASCCYPTAGNVMITGRQSGTYAFGPGCGHMTKNSQKVVLDTCD